MSKDFVVNPQSVSFSQWVTDIKNYISSKNDYMAWKDFFNSSAGTTLIELMAGMGVWLQHKAITGRRETYLPYAEFRSSAVASAEARGYSVDRGKNANLYLVVNPTAAAVIPKFSVVGTVKSQDLTVLEDITLNVGVTAVVPCAVGNVNYEDVYIPDSQIQLFRFSNPKVTENIKLSKGVYTTPNDPTSFTGIEVETSERVADLLFNKYIVLTNTLDAVDVSYLNNDPSDPYFYNTGQYLRLEYIEAYDQAFDFSDVSFNYGTILGYVYAGTVVWSTPTTYDLGDIVVPVNPQRYGVIPTWSINTPYTIGDIVRSTTFGSTYDGYFRCNSDGNSHIATEPDWSTIPNVGEIIDDNTTSWERLSLFADGTTPFDFAGIYYETEILGTSGTKEPLFTTINGNKIVDIICPVWRASTNTYSTGDIIKPTWLQETGYFYVCADDAGGTATSGAAEPTWAGVVPGDPVITDGAPGAAYSWLCVESNGGITPARWVAVVNDVRENSYIEPESIDAIKVNAPMYYETQFTIRARDDYMKAFKFLDSRIADTNYQDITPAVVELTYVRDDLQLYNNLQKQELINQLSAMRPHGVPNPIISDPSQVDYTFDFTVFLDKFGSFPVVDDVTALVNSYDKKLWSLINTYDIQKAIEDLEYDEEQYVKQVRMTIHTENWSYGQAYRRGDFVIPMAGTYLAAAGYIFECIQAGTSSGVIQPIWTNILNPSISPIDVDLPGTIVASDINDGGCKWRCRQQIDNSTPGSLFDYQILSKLAWNEYYKFTSNITVIPA
jgi:hypothetical protein